MIEKTSYDSKMWLIQPKQECKSHDRITPYSDWLIISDGHHSTSSPSHHQWLHNDARTNKQLFSSFIDSPLDQWLHTSRSLTTTDIDAKIFSERDQTSITDEEMPRADADPMESIHSGMKSEVADSVSSEAYSDSSMAYRSDTEAYVYEEDGSSIEALSIEDEWQTLDHYPKVTIAPYGNKAVQADDVLPSYTWLRT